MSRFWRSIKVKEDTYQRLRSMGLGIDKAIRTLLKEREEEIVGKITSIERKAREIADEMIRRGVFDIRFKGASIISVSEENDDLVIKLFLRINVPDPGLREFIYNKLVGEEDEQD